MFGARIRETFAEPEKAGPRPRSTSRRSMARRCSRSSTMTLQVARADAGATGKSRAITNVAGFSPTPSLSSTDCLTPPSSKTISPERTALRSYEEKK